MRIDLVVNLEGRIILNERKGYIWTPFTQTEKENKLARNKLAHREESAFFLLFFFTIGKQAELGKGIVSKKTY